MPAESGAPDMMVIQDEPGLAAFIVSLLQRAGGPPRVVILSQAPGDIVVALLRREGHQVQIASGAEVLELALSANPELVLLDFRALERTMNELKQAQQRLGTLTGFMPICSHCKKVRRPDAVWEEIDSFLSQYIPVQFTHTLCPEHLETT